MAIVVCVLRFDFLILSVTIFTVLNFGPILMFHLFAACMFVTIMLYAGFYMFHEMLVFQLLSLKIMSTISQFLEENVYIALSEDCIALITVF